MKEILEKLIKRQNLTSNECKTALKFISESENVAQGAAFLALMRAKGETLDEISYFIDFLRDNMVRINASSPVLDIVGTGGDHSNTVNISTGSAILAAASGVKVAKHGARASSSKCGSADVLEELGLYIKQPPEVIKQHLEKFGIAFMFAPMFHPTWIKMGPTRKQLGIKTVFNFLGPLVNPARADHFVIGVYSSEILPFYVNMLSRTSPKRSFVFHGCGLDELTPLGVADVYQIEGQTFKRFEFDPLEYGIPRCRLQDLKGGDRVINAHLLQKALKGELGPIAHSLVINAGFAVYAYGLENSLQESMKRAATVLKSGAAFELLKNWIQASPKPKQE